MPHSIRALLGPVVCHPTFSYLFFIYLLFFNDTVSRHHFYSYTVILGCRPARGIQT